MAQRRMFAMKIIDSDAFLDMPLSTQALYFHLCMRADDDGFVNNPKKIQRAVGASDDDLKVLAAKRFIIPFESGIVVIKHWRIHNYIRIDRYTPTAYTEERAMLAEKDNGSYTVANTIGIPSVNQTDTNDIPSDIPTVNQMTYQMDTQYSKGKDSKGKDIDNVSIDKSIDISPTNVIKGEGTKRRFTPPTLEEVCEYCRGRNNGVDAAHFIDYYQARDWCLSKGVKMKDWRAAVRTWEHRDKPKNKLSNLERLYREEIERNGQG